MRIGEHRQRERAKPALKTSTSCIWDYIIVGSGLAGLNSALKAAAKGSVLLITKKKLTDCNTFYAQGGIAAVLGKTDDFKKHIHDTFVAGAFHNNPFAVKFIIENGPAAIQQLIEYGVQFTKNSQGDLELHLEGGHQHQRIVHSGDYTGKTIEEKLVELVKKNRNITVLENTFAVDLLVKKKVCYGVLIMTKKNARGISAHKTLTQDVLIGNVAARNVFARKTILATGGIGQLYAKTTNPKVATGDGIALAVRAGCKVADMEFVQFHPTAFAKGRSPLFLISEAVRGAGAILLNSKKERFMPRYHPQAELAPRDIVSRAISEEEKKGPVYLQMKNQKAARAFPQISTYLKKQGLALAKDLIPITPVAHFLCGGIATNLKGATPIKNLYAFGETACTGLHGANRLASNSLLEALVMSNEIIKSPLATFKKIPHFPNFSQSTSTTKISLHKMTTAKITTSKIPAIKKKLQSIMWQNVGIIRNESKLKTALQKITQLQKNLLPPKHHHLTPLQKNLTQPTTPATINMLETRNMLAVAELIIKAALKRKKSLGTHYRTN